MRPKPPRTEPSPTAFQSTVEESEGSVFPRNRHGDPLSTSLALAEQRRIVAYLDELQEKADALKTLQAETSAELDALMPSILDQAFCGEL